MIDFILHDLKIFVQFIVADPAIFWIVVAIVACIMYIVTMSTYSGNDLMGMFAGAIVPSSVKVANILRFIGACGIISSCVLLLLFSKKTEENK